MTATIASTVTSALPARAASQYSTEVNAVVEALTERDHQLTDVITATVVSQFGVSAGQVQEALTGIGMAVRPAPEPEPELPTFEDEPLAEEAPAKGKKGGKKGKRVDRLEATVNKLVELAERHLGAGVR